MPFIAPMYLRAMQDEIATADRVLREGGDKAATETARLALMRATSSIVAALDAIASPGLREEAHDQYGTDDIEIDDEPGTSEADNGTWVAAWVWIAQPESDDGDDTSEDGEV